MVAFLAPSRYTIGYPGGGALHGDPVEAGAGEVDGRRSPAGARSAVAAPVGGGDIVVGPDAGLHDAPVCLIVPGGARRSGGRGARRLARDGYPHRTVDLDLRSGRGVLVDAESGLGLRRLQVDDLGLEAVLRQDGFRLRFGEAERPDRRHDDGLRLWGIAHVDLHGGAG